MYISREVYNSIVVENKEMRKLLIDLLPDMECRVDGLRKSWPGPDILTALHRNESFVDQIKKFVKEEL